MGLLKKRPKQRRGAEAKQEDGVDIQYCPAVFVGTSIHWGYRDIYEDKGPFEGLTPSKAF